MNFSNVNESLSTEYSGITILAPGAFMLSLLIIFGNLTTLIAIKRMPSLQTKSNAYVASLACADIMVGLVLIPYGLWLIPDIRNRFDQTVTMCNLIMSAGSSAIVVSILNLLLVALERMVYINYPFFYVRVINNNVIGVSITFPWLIGLTFGNSQWFINVPKTNPPQCVANKILPTFYYKYVATLMYFIPSAAIFAIYTKIIMIARKHSTAIKKMNVVQPSSDKAAWASRPMAMSDENWKAAKMMMTVFGLFFTCWTPRFILHTVPDDYLNKSVPEIVYNLFMMMGLLNSGINFLVYPLHNMEFRKALIHLLCFWSRSHDQLFSVVKDIHITNISTGKNLK
ncbi:trace amine-associated receptor 7b [Biomphalaria glabrata]|nr:trace amine-associated receptor 7b-like [Biomphalaria glabrata]